MPDVYAVADGHGVADGSLIALPQQPALPDGLRYAELNFYGDSSANVNGYLQGVLVWSFTDRDQYTATLTAFGVSETTRSNEVTVRVRTNGNSFARFNCTAVFTQDHRRSRGVGAFWENLVIVLNELEAL
jgi:hypothetical protein